MGLLSKINILSTALLVGFVSASAFSETTTEITKYISIDTALTLGEGELDLSEYIKSSESKNYINSLSVVAASGHDNTFFELSINGQSLGFYRLQTRHKPYNFTVDMELSSLEQVQVRADGLVQVVGLLINSSEEVVQKASVAPYQCAPRVEAPQGPKCQILGAGTYGGHGWNYRLARDGVPVAGYDRWDQLIGFVRDIALPTGLCKPQKVRCTALQRQEVRGYTWNYVLAMDDNEEAPELIEGKNNYEEWLKVYVEVKDLGFCRNPANKLCEIVSKKENERGLLYNGVLWNHLLYAGDHVVDGFARLDEASARMVELKLQKLCY